MQRVTFIQLFLILTALWLILRAVAWSRHRGEPGFLKRELPFVALYLWLVFILRFAFFPMNAGLLPSTIFDPRAIFNPNINLEPVVHFHDAYSGWWINLYGNIAVFIPLGFILPFCFPNAFDRLWKTALGGLLCSLCIEVLQLPFPTRCSDVDDLLTNTLGVIIGASIVFIVRAIRRRGNRHKERT